jgi:hypothetical protein
MPAQSQPPILKVADFSSTLSQKAILEGLFPEPPTAKEESREYQVAICTAHANL